MTSLTLPDSLWAATAKAAPKLSPLQVDQQVDVAIIGAGFTGLRAATILAEAGMRVAVVDSGDVGWGASGRNGGQVNPMGHEPPAVIGERWNRKFSGDYVERYVDMTIQSADEVFAVIEKYGIDCDAEQNGWIRALHGEAARAEFEALYQGWNAAGAGLRLLDNNELERLSGTSSYQSGWVAERGGSLQPLSYVRGLARAAREAGAEIFIHTTVSSLQREGDQWKLGTEQGVIAADQVIAGTNGYSDQLIPGLRESIVPVVSIQAATRPLTPEQNAGILAQRHTFSDTRRVIFYFRKTADNRLVFGSAGTAGEMPGISERTRIMKGLVTVYSQFPDLELDYIWGGQIAVTQDHLPHIHQPAPGLHVGLGCNGRGVALSTVMGRLLAQTVLGESPADLPIPVSPIKKYPFHRFHKVGIKIAVAWKEFLDRREARR